MTKSNWKKCKLGDIADIIMGSSPKGCDINENEEGIPFFQGSAEFSYRYPIVKKYTTKSIRQAKKGDILFSVRAPIADINIAQEDCAIGRGIAAIRSRKLDLQRYVEFVLKGTRNRWEYLNSSGSVFGCAKKEDLLNFEIYWNDNLDVLLKISQVLGAFDDKIELLQKQNKTLEEMAKAIFKSWFVDFDIVRAKQKGEKKEDIIKNYHLTEELYNLFPSSFEQSSLGPIPTNWKVKKTCEISDIIIGRTPPRKQTEWFSNDSSNIAWISIKDMGNCGVFIDKSSEYLTREAISKFRIPLIPPKTVVLSFKLTVGRVSITTKQMCSNEAIAQFKDSTIPTIYLYLALKHINFSLLGSTSSIATAINSNTIKNMHLLIPYSALLKSFDKKTMLLFDKISNNIQQIQTLTELRDTLLPRLISGKIKV